MLAVAPVCIAAFADYPAAINVPLIHANIKTVTSRFLKKDSVCAMHVHSKKFLPFFCPRWYAAAASAIIFLKRNSGPPVHSNECISCRYYYTEAAGFFFFLQKQDRATHVHCLYFLPLVYCSHCRNFFF